MKWIGMISYKFKVFKTFKLSFIIGKFVMLILDVSLRKGVQVGNRHLLDRRPVELTTARISSNRS